MMLPQFFEYAHTHPAFNHKLTHKMTVWEADGGIVAFCGYEMDVGEAYLVCGKGYDHLLPEMLTQTEEELYIEANGKRSLSVSAIDTQEAHIALLKNSGYEVCYTEPIRIYRYSNGFGDLRLPEGFTCRSIEGDIDFHKLDRCIWRGFNHGDEVEYDIDGKKYMLSGPDYRTDLGRIIVAPNGEYACFAGMWLDERNGYAYLEPLCTMPEYRNMGLARYALTDAMKKTEKLGAEYCFGGVPEFYTAIGFETVATRQMYNKEWTLI
jgi:ribosomal protein S18 acetylase RimI-like enzyme